MGLYIFDVEAALDIIRRNYRDLSVPDISRIEFRVMKNPGMVQGIFNPKIILNDNYRIEEIGNSNVFLAMVMEEVLHYNDSFIDRYLDSDVDFWPFDSFHLDIHREAWNKVRLLVDDFNELRKEYLKKYCHEW